MEPIFDFTRHFAVFYDEAGNFHGKKRISKDTVTFKYCGRAYIFRPKQSSYFKNWNVLWNTKYYSYNLDNPEPLQIRQGYEPVMTATDFNNISDTAVMKDLISLSRENWLTKLLTPTNMIILGVIIAVLWYMNSNGGKLW